MKRILPIVRTHTNDQQSVALVAQLTNAFEEDAVVVHDNRRGGFASDWPRKLALNKATLEDNDLSRLPGRWAWLCGDICYYVAQRHFPGYDYYLLVENDVYLPDSVVTELVERLKGFSGDAIAFGLHQNPDRQPPKYSRGLSALGKSPFVGCTFPLTVASPKLIGLMREVRQAACDAGLIVNDESVFASAVFETARPYETLEDFLAPHAAKGSFRTNPPFLLEAVQRQADLRVVCHPAIPLKTILQRISSGKRNYSPYRLREVLKSANDDERRLIEAALRGAARK